MRIMEVSVCFELNAITQKCRGGKTAGGMGQWPSGSSVELFVSVCAQV